jgi:hypothetical protein
VDDIPFLYKLACTKINECLHEFNDQCPQAQFTLEPDENNTINFLGITITRLLAQKFV